jgi:hypothetical protein
MEDWQEWQIRADRIAGSLNEEVDKLETEYLAGDEAAASLRGFWSRFRQLKEQVRTAPAIRLEAKLDLERRLRGLGSRAYKVQQQVNSASGRRKEELLASIGELRSAIEAAESPRDLRMLRRQLEPLRKQFDAGADLVPADRQAVWEEWRETNQLAWDRLTSAWSENEVYLQGILDQARQNMEQRSSNAARQLVSRFFESLRTHETKQESMNRLKAEAESLRDEAAQVEERRAADAAASRGLTVSPLESWRAELDKNRETLGRLQEEVVSLEQQVQETRSVLDQAMMRGPLNDKRQRVAELERTNRTLEQRLEAAEEAPMISST